MSNGWHYAEGEKTVGPLDLKALQTVLSSVPDPHSLLVWKAGFKGLVPAKDVLELVELISKPPPLPKPTEPRSKRWSTQGVWRSAAAVGVSVGASAVVADYSIGAAIGALPLALALDWATRRRRQHVDSIIAAIPRP
jgi:hypothetical protein